MMHFLRWFLDRHLFIPHWDQKRVQQYELVNKLQLGIVCEPVFIWSHQYRKK